MAGINQSFKDLSPDDVEEIHKKSDVDVRKESQHHTLGPRPSQAAAGDHKHDGSDSALLLEGVTITGSRASSASIMPSVIAALVKLGATDSSTA